MQGWIVAGAWLFAVLFALVILGFTAYELSWKARRLQSDTSKLVALLGQLAATAADLQGCAERAQSYAHRPASPARGAEWATD
jgi:hypothetical protein